MSDRNADILPSPIVTAESTPGKDDLWEFPDGLIVNWEIPLINRTGWSTDVGESRNVSEARRSLVDRPFRSHVYSFTGIDRRDTARILSMMRRLATARFALPLYTDVTKLDAAAAQLDEELRCDPSNRRFFPGMRALVMEPTAHRSAAEASRIVQIEAVDEARGVIGLTGAVLRDFPAGSRVFPLVESRVSLTQDAGALSDRNLVVTLQFIETEGYSAMPRLADPGETPAGFDEYQGLPIFDESFNWTDVTVGIFRDGSYEKIGLGNVLQLKGDRPRLRFRGPFLARNRAQAWRILRFFDSRAGRTHPFWFPSPIDEFDLIALSTSDMTVAAEGAEFDWNFRPHVFLLQRDGTLLVREVSSVVRSSGQDVVTFADPIPSLTLSQIRRTGTATKARFASDELEEQWPNAGLMNLNFQIVELIEEKELVLQDLDSPGTETDGLPVLDPSKACASRWVQLQAEQNNPGWNDVDVWFHEDDLFRLLITNPCIPDEVIIASPSGAPFAIEYVSSSDRIYVGVGGQIDVIDPTTEAIVNTIALPSSFIQQNNLRYAASIDRVYAFLNDGDVAVIDPSTETVVETFTLGFAPFETAFHPTNGFFYAAPDFTTFPDSVRKIDTATNTLGGTISLTDPATSEGNEPQGLQVVDEFVFASALGETNEQNAACHRIKIADDSVRWVLEDTGGFPQFVARHLPSQAFFAPQHEKAVYDPNTDRIYWWMARGAFSTTGLMVIDPSSDSQDLVDEGFANDPLLEERRFELSSAGVEVPITMELMENIGRIAFVGANPDPGTSYTDDDKVRVYDPAGDAITKVITPSAGGTVQYSAYRPVNNRLYVTATAPNNIYSLKVL